MWPGSTGAQLGPYFLAETAVSCGVRAARVEWTSGGTLIRLGGVPGIASSRSL